MEYVTKIIYESLDKSRPMIATFLDYHNALRKYFRSFTFNIAYDLLSLSSDKTVDDTKKDQMNICLQKLNVLFVLKSYLKLAKVRFSTVKEYPVCFRCLLVERRPHLVHKKATD